METIREIVCKGLVGDLALIRRGRPRAALLALALWIAFRAAAVLNRVLRTWRGGAKWHEVASRRNAQRQQV